MITYIFCAAKYSSRYKIGQWGSNVAYTVTDFSVKQDKTELSMFNVGFKIDVKMKISPKRDSYPSPEIDDIHISERLEKQGNETVAVIEFTPIMKSMREGDFPGEEKEYSFSYKLNTFKSSSVNKYIIKCGELRRTISVTQKK